MRRSHDKRIVSLEEFARANSSTLRLTDGRQVRLSPTAWLDIADVMIEQTAAQFEGEDPPEPTEMQRQLIALYGQALPDPAWGTGEHKVWTWAREQVGGDDESP
jgi:hypothetical protein